MRPNARCRALPALMLALLAVAPPPAAAAVNRQLSALNLDARAGLEVGPARSNRRPRRPGTRGAQWR